MGLPWYCTREDVQRALDVKETARSFKRIDRAIEASSRTIEGKLHRRFYPQIDTRSFDWPNSQRARPWRLWLDANEIISVTSFTSGGVTIESGDFLLYPTGGPPYNRIEISLDSFAAFSAGDTHQQSIDIAGLWGWRNDTEPAGTLAEDLDASETSVDVSDSAAIGVGDLIQIGSERMLVTGRSMLDTGQDLAADLTSQNSAVTVAVTTGSEYMVDEVLLIDSERMLVVDIAGNNLIVRRAWDGSVLASHTSGAGIFAPRTLVVERAAVGSTAATHTTAAAITRHVPPGPVSALCVGLSLSQLLQEQAGYARTAGSGDNQREVIGRGLRALWEAAYASCGRKARVRGV